MLLAEAVVNTGEDVHHEVVGDELTIVYKALGGLAKFCTILDFVAENVTC